MRAPVRRAAIGPGKGSRPAATANDPQHFAARTTDYEGLVSGVIRLRDSQLCPGP